MKALLTYIVHSDASHPSASLKVHARLLSNVFLSNIHASERELSGEARD